VLFEGIELPPRAGGLARAGIFPALSASSYCEQPLVVRANFGEREWVCGPPDGGYGVFPPATERAMATALPHQPAYGNGRATFT
jgi:hypothetical protein